MRLPSASGRGKRSTCWNAKTAWAWLYWAGHTITIPASITGFRKSSRNWAIPFSQSTLPLDEDLLDRLFGEEVRAGVISHPLDISDVWKSSSAASSSMKVWAAKFTARHPNLIAVEISSFKCGHDAPIYTVVEQIIEQSHTPYFCFKDLDENKPVASIRIRVETIDYFLKRYREDIARERDARHQIEARLAAYERELRRICA